MLPAREAPTGRGWGSHTITEKTMTPNPRTIDQSPGLHRAKLAAIRTQSWTVDGQPLTGEQVVAYYCKIRERSLYDVPRSSRRFDRAVAILKREGLITFVKGGVGWRCTDEVSL